MVFTGIAEASDDDVHVRIQHVCPGDNWEERDNWVKNITNDKFGFLFCKICEKNVAMTEISVETKKLLLEIS